MIKSIMTEAQGVYYLNVNIFSLVLSVRKQSSGKT